MEYYAGIDVSLEASSVCVVDGTGKIVKEAKVLSEPEDLIGWFKALPFALARIGLEAGPLSQWLYAGLKKAGLAVELLETRHVRAAFKTMPVKTDRKDAHRLALAPRRSLCIAQLMRLGWFRPVHCKSVAAQETRALLTARKLVKTKLIDVQMSLRGILRGFGLKVGPVTPARFTGAGSGSLRSIIRPCTACYLSAERDRQRACRRACGAFTRACRLRQTAAQAGQGRCPRAAVDDGAGRGPHRGADLCFSH